MKRRGYEGRGKGGQVSIESRRSDFASEVGTPTLRASGLPGQTALRSKCSKELQNINSAAP